MPKMALCLINPGFFIKLYFFIDKCGATSKVHLIIRHKNPINGSISVIDKFKILRCTNIFRNIALKLVLNQRPIILEAKTPIYIR